MALLLVVLAALSGLAQLLFVAPGYMTECGFPLDDAWIHAVYGRELARSAMLAYNPGIPATGSTAPLWSGVFGVVHLATARVGTMLMLVKIIGFALHLGTALLVYAALADADHRMRLAGAALVAMHPDLVSASVSGMEIPLATMCAVGLWCVLRRNEAILYAGLSAVAVLARPELTVVAVALPLLGIWYDRRRFRLAFAAGCGALAVFAPMMLRNLAVSGRPLPATFYAKVDVGPRIAESLGLGFRDLLGQFPIADSSILLTVWAGLSLAVITKQWPRRGLLDAASAFAAGLIFCIVSFALIPPTDPAAFYHQRYVLPALPLLLGPAPMLLGAWLSERIPVGYRLPAEAALVLLFAVSLMIAAPARFEHLANDAHNIDDVQVRVGRALGGANATDVVLAVDAGAIRYFGNAFVIDMIGLNTPQMIGAGAQAFLQAHPPRYVEIVPGWSGVDDASARSLRVARYAPSTSYTVTSFAPMQEHFLARCDAATAKLGYRVGNRPFEIECSG